MLFKKLLRTIWHYKAQFFSMIIMVLLGVGIFVGFQGEWFSIEKNTFSFYEQTGFADYRLICETGYSLEEMEKIQSIKGVDKVSRFVSVNTDNKTKDDDVISVNVTTNFEVSSFVLTSGEKYDESSLDGVWMSDSYAEKNGYKLNDDISLKYGAITLSGKIKGLIKSSEYLICVPDENQLMPNFNTYGYVFISPSKYESIIGGDFYPQIHVISDLTKKEFSDEANEKLGKTNMILTKHEIISYEEAQGEASEGKTMASVIPVIFLGIAVLIMATTMQRLTINEKTQIGTLKALGFRDRKIVRHYTLFGLFIGIVGSLLGIGLGYFIAWFIFNKNGSMGTYFDLPTWDIVMPWWTFLVVAGIVAFMTLISYLSAKRMLKGTAADALKPYTPKAMKRLKIEDSKGWRRMKFATKWNIRDLLRHGARSGMTLFGVFGCTMLLVASFLTLDSEQGFVNKFYYDSMNYETQISLSADVTNEKALNIAEYFNGDYSASTSVMLDDEVISMDIYSVENNYVRFLDKKMKFKTLSDDGIYVGQRLLKENHLQIGDEITVYVFGSSTHYKLRIAGDIRSLSKGVVMTFDYANDEEVGIDYKINQIFTNKSKDEINRDGHFNDCITATNNRADIIKSFDSFMEVLYVMISALIILSVTLSVVVLYNLGTMSYFERYRELSTLKVVGFKDKHIGKLLITQNLWLTIAGFVIGFPAGVGVTYLLINTLASEYEMMMIFGWMTFVIPILLVFGVSLLVSWLVARKSRKIDMVEALKVPE